MTDIKQYLPYCVFQETTIKSVDENEFTNGKYRVNSLTYNLIHKYAYDDDNEDYTIIPHMRKLSSLTEDEARELVVLHYGESYREELTKEHYCKDELRKPQLEFVSIVGYMVHYRAWGRSNEFGLLTKYNFEQFHYLTSIGIAWWATEDMWESGALIESNQEQK